MAGALTSVVFTCRSYGALPSQGARGTINMALLRSCASANSLTLAFYICTYRPSLSQGAKSWERRHPAGRIVLSTPRRQDAGARALEKERALEGESPSVAVLPATS